MEARGGSVTCLRPHSLDVVKLELTLRCIRIQNLHARGATASPLRRRTLRPKGQRDDLVHDFFFLPLLIQGYY